jgi:hypothetical protein
MKHVKRLSQAFFAETRSILIVASMSSGRTLAPAVDQIKRLLRFFSYLREGSRFCDANHSVEESDRRFILKYVRSL